MNFPFDFKYFDMIIGMDNQNIHDLKAMTSNEVYLQKISKMTDYGDLTSHDGVPDPYYPRMVSNSFWISLRMLRRIVESYFAIVVMF